MHIDFKKKTNDRHFQKAKILEEILLSKKKKKNFGEGKKGAITLTTVNYMLWQSHTQGGGRPRGGGNLKKKSTFLKIWLVKIDVGSP